MDTIAYFVAQSSFTDPGEYAELFAVLPKDAEAIRTVIQGLFLDHKERYKYPIVNERLLHSHSHCIQGVIKSILSWSKAPLNEAREIPDRFLAAPHDYANMFCAMARSQGIAARKRVGFLCDEVYRGYEVAEYWDGTAWKQIDVAGLAKSKFMSAAEAWQACRKGEIDPELFHADLQTMGLEVVRNSLMLDLAAMNKVELLAWDRYGWMLRPFEDFSEKAWNTLDKAAELLLADDVEALQALYNSEEGIEVPRIVKCDTPLVPPHKAELPL